MGTRTHNKTRSPLICIALKSTWNLTNEAKKREKGCGMDGEVFIPCGFEGATVRCTSSQITLHPSQN